MRRNLGVGYKSCRVLLHKLREAMAGELKDRMIGGAGKVAEVDGGYFGGYVRPAVCGPRRSSSGNGALERRRSNEQMGNWLF